VRVDAIAAALALTLFLYSAMQLTVRIHVVEAPVLRAARGERVPTCRLTSNLTETGLSYLYTYDNGTLVKLVCGP